MIPTIQAQMICVSTSKIAWIYLDLIKRSRESDNLIGFTCTKVAMTRIQNPKISKFWGFLAQSRERKLEKRVENKFSIHWRQNLVDQGIMVKYSLLCTNVAYSWTFWFSYTTISSYSYCLHASIFWVNSLSFFNRTFHLFCNCTC